MFFTFENRLFQVHDDLQIVKLDLQIFAISLQNNGISLEKICNLVWLTSLSCKLCDLVVFE